MMTRLLFLTVLVAVHVAAFVPASLKHNGSLRMSATEQDTVDLSIPYDAAARLAYDAWRKEYDKGGFDEARYQNFKANYEAITVANIKSKRAAKEKGQDVPEKLTLNEYGDCSAEEYEDMQSSSQPTSTGDILGKAVESASAQSTASSAIKEAADALAEEEEKLAQQLGLNSVEELEAAMDAFEGIDEEGVQEPDNLAREARVRSAYIDWCKEYNREQDEARFQTFFDNFLTMEEYAAQEGKEMKLNRFADCTEEEYLAILAKEGPAEPVKTPEADKLKKSAVTSELFEDLDVIEALKAAAEAEAAVEAAKAEARAEADAKAAAKAKAIQEAAEQKKAEMAKESEFKRLSVEEQRQRNEEERRKRQAEQEKAAEELRKANEAAAIAAVKASADQEAAQVAKRRAMEQKAAEEARKRAKEWEAKQTGTGADRAPPKSKRMSMPMFGAFSSKVKEPEKKPNEMSFDNLIQKVIPTSPKPAPKSSSAFSFLDGPKPDAKKTSAQSQALSILESLVPKPEPAPKPAPSSASKKNPAPALSFLESLVPKPSPAPKPAPSPSPASKRDPAPALSFLESLVPKPWPAPKPAPSPAPAAKKVPAPALSFLESLVPKPSPAPNPSPAPATTAKKTSAPAFSLFESLAPKPTPSVEVAPAQAPVPESKPFSFFGGSTTLSKSTSKNVAKKPTSRSGTISIKKAEVTEKARTGGFSFFSGSVGESSTKVADDIPILSKFVQNPDGSLTGFVKNAKGFRNGTKITTSPVRRGAKAGQIVTTKSGSRYLLE